MPLSPTGLRNTPGDFFKVVFSQLTSKLIHYSKKFLLHYCYKSLIFRLCRVCFEEFGDSVKFWITLNEPKETSLQVDCVFTIDETVSTIECESEKVRGSKFSEFFLISSDLVQILNSKWRTS